MKGFGLLATAVAVVGLWVTRKNAKRPVAGWMWKIAIWQAPLALLGILVGWIFTEMGRQPWVVFGLMKTADGVSPTLTTFQVGLSLVVFTLLYGALAVVEVGLLIRAVKIGPPETVELIDASEANSGKPLTFSY